MIFELGNKVFKFPDSWDELSNIEFINVSTAVFDYIFYVPDASILMFRIFQVLTGYERSGRSFTSDQEDVINENIYTIAESINFYRRPKYSDPTQLDIFSDGTRELLLKQFPDQITDTAALKEIKPLIHLIQYTSEIVLDIRKNPISRIIIDNQELESFRFSINDHGIFSTDLSAERYIDSQDNFHLFHKTKDEQYLKNIVTILFYPKGKKYSFRKSQQLAKSIKDKDPFIYATYILFTSIYDFITTRSGYSILYSATSSEGEKISLGPIGTLYELSKQGFGDIELMKDLPLIDYLNLMVKQLIDSVKEMRAYKKTNAEIAKTLKLDIKIVASI